MTKTTSKYWACGIIKPDGTVNEVSTDEYMTATEGRKDREQRQKLSYPTGNR